MQMFNQALPKQEKEVVYMTVQLQQTIPLPKRNMGKDFYLGLLQFYNFGAPVPIVTDSLDVSHSFTLECCVFGK